MNQIVEEYNMVVDSDGNVLNAGDVPNHVLDEYADLFIDLNYSKLDNSLEPVRKDMEITFPKLGDNFKRWEPQRNLISFNEFLNRF